MTDNNGKNIQTAICFASYLLSGTMIFSPLHKSGSLLISLIFAFVTGLLCVISAIYLSYGKNCTAYFCKPLYTVFCVLSAIISVLSCLILLTEIIKDVSYIANRGISLAYYTFIALAILVVSYYLCYNSQKGIFRFCILSILPFLLLYIVIFLSFSSVGFSDTELFLNSGTDKPLSAIRQGIVSGLFFFSDTYIFIYCFHDYVSTDRKTTVKKNLIYGYLIAFGLLAIYNTVTFLIFGKNLTFLLDDPDYALIKLLPGIDMTEIISLLRITSFMIKSSVYIFSASLACGRIFVPQKKHHIIFIAIMYLLIPIIFLCLAFARKSLEYGAFQHMIYPLVTSLSLLFAFMFLLSKKNTG